jgi:hypothetical protein
MSKKEKYQNEVLAYIKIELSLLNEKISYYKIEYKHKKNLPTLLENLETQKMTIERILKVSETLFITQ